MSTIKNGNRFAFPSADDVDGPCGLTKRECFAAMAMSGLCASVATCGRSVSFKEVSSDAINVADALLAALEADHE